MALVRLSDVVVPTVFQRYLTSDTMVNTNIFTSGIFRPDANLAGFLSGGGLTVNVP